MFINAGLFFGIIVAVNMTIWVWGTELFYCSNEILCLIQIGFLFFLYGLMTGYPYFIPNILFTIRFTEENCGAAISILEFIGYIIGGPYILFMAYLSKYGWRYVWIFFIFNVIIGTIFYYYFNKENIIKKEKEEKYFYKMVKKMNNNDTNHINCSNNINDSNNFVIFLFKIYYYIPTKSLY